eukprot:TRINITY_DN69_c0_g1_i1.p1 TRINITY_DN69_c0_g1~~TRINITY_DN69_c0_g1_i1.p1  ORF type:complete len:135 (+),score=28.46 TRINITY_DN69_c0_g1_i1:122-526(+)
MDFLFGSDGFSTAKEKSEWLFQYKCCRKEWWGSFKNNTCKKCHSVVEKLPLPQMTGIGWFRCTCGRTFAGYIRGDVKSKCHSCGTESLAQFIVPSDKDSPSKDGKHSHHCAVCKGSGYCPIVAKAGGSVGRRCF